MKTIFTAVAVNREGVSGLYSLEKDVPILLTEGTTLTFGHRTVEGGSPLFEVATVFFDPIENEVEVDFECGMESVEFLLSVGFKSRLEEGDET